MKSWDARMRWKNSSHKSKNRHHAREIFLKIYALKIQEKTTLVKKILMKLFWKLVYISRLGHARENFKLKMLMEDYARDRKLNQCWWIFRRKTENAARPCVQREMQHLVRFGALGVEKWMGRRAWRAFRRVARMGVQARAELPSEVSTKLSSKVRDDNVIFGAKLRFSRIRVFGSAFQNWKVFAYKNLYSKTSQSLKRLRDVFCVGFFRQTFRSEKAAKTLSRCTLFRTEEQTH